MAQAWLVVLPHKSVLETNTFPMPQYPQGLPQPTFNLLYTPVLLQLFSSEQSLWWPMPWDHTSACTKPSATLEYCVRVAIFLGSVFSCKWAMPLHGTSGTTQAKWFCLTCTACQVLPFGDLPDRLHIYLGIALNVPLTQGWDFEVLRNPAKLHIVIFTDCGKKSVWKREFVWGNSKGASKSHCSTSCSKHTPTHKCSWFFSDY